MLDNAIFRKFKKVCKKGTVISLKQSRLNQVILNVIQNVEANNIYFRASNEFLMGNILEGDSLECTVVIDEEEYVLAGTIVKIESSYPNMVDVIIDDIKNFKNRREHKRYLANFQANMFVPIENNYAKYSIVKNISNKGLCLITNKSLEAGTNVRIKITVNIDEVKTIEFNSEIKRAYRGEAYSEYGLEISQIDEINKDLMDKLIYKLDKNESRFVAENLK